MRPLALVTVALGLITPALSNPSAAPLWIDANDAPLPLGARSVLVLRKDEPLYFEPKPGAKRRGSAALETRLPLYAITRGPGCTNRWLNVGPQAWVCADHVELSREPAISPVLSGSDSSPRYAGGALPYLYHFVLEEGSFGYKNLSLAEEGIPDAQLEPGFAVALLTVRNKPGGDPFGLTTKGFWVPMRDLAPANPIAFSGEQTHDITGLGWTVADETPVYDAPSGRKRGEALERRTKVRTLSETTKHRTDWVMIGPEQWVKKQALSLVEPAAAPAEIQENERWIDVDLKNQVLTAYEGSQPVLATLVSTGRGPKDTVLATPVGSHRVWVKLLSSDMDNLEDESAGRYYAIQDVPWVMYFNKGYGLHAAFWHRDFGRVRSHGCVNLPPSDAKWLFNWARPHLPAGWTAALPTAYDPGTLVRVR